MTEKTVFMILRCTECNTPANDPDNPKITYEMRLKIVEDHNSWNGWLCKCGHYNALDP